MTSSLQSLSRLLRRSPLSTTLVAPLAGIMLFMTAIVSPIGDFPLNDDWVYMEIVRELVENHVFYEHPYRGSLVISLTAWGALFCSVFGVSYTVLRISTLALALVAIWATARGALDAGLPRSLALLCGAVLLANPVFLNLAYTFMSDVPFLALMSCAGLFYVRALTSRSAALAFWGSTFLVAACLTKQIGIVLIVAFAATEVVSWLRRTERPEPRLIAAFAVPLVVGGALYLATFGLPSVDNVYFWPKQAAKPSLLGSLPVLVRHAASAILYLGLFTLPIALVRFAALARGTTHRTRRQWVAFLGVCVVLQLATVSIQHGVLVFRSMPLLPNVLYDLGTGPITLRDVYVMGEPRPKGIGSWWWLVHLLSLCSSASLIVDLFPRLVRHVFTRTEADDDQRGASTLFLVLWVAAITLFPYHLLTHTLYDRYLLSTLFPVTLLAAGSLLPAERRALRTGWIGAGTIFLFSLLAVHDYLSWNTARWEAADYLRNERGLDPKEIDGGFEYNGVHLSAEYRKRHDVTSFWNQGPTRFWLLEETRYAIYKNHVAGCRTLKNFPYLSLVGMETRTLLALHCPARR